MQTLPLLQHQIIISSRTMITSTVQVWTIQCLFLQYAECKLKDWNVSRRLQKKWHCGLAQCSVCTAAAGFKWANADLSVMLIMWCSQFQKFMSDDVNASDILRSSSWLQTNKSLTACTCLASANTHVTLYTYQQSLNDGVPVLAFVVHHLNVIQVSVSPVHKLADQVQSDAVREDDFTVY